MMNTWKKCIGFLIALVTIPAAIARVFVVFFGNRKEHDDMGWTDEIDKHPWGDLILIATFPFLFLTSFFMSLFQGTMYIWKKYTEWVRKNSWLGMFLTLLAVMACPFIGLFINEKTGISIFGELYTFGLPLKDFTTSWIAFWGIIGLGLNVWLMLQRVAVMEKQLRETRFTSSVELLGNDNQSARIGGVYSLYYLAHDHEEYRETICEILCAHIRTVTSEKDYQDKYKEHPSNEIQTILNLLFKKDKKDDVIFDNFDKNLKKTFLSGAKLSEAILSNVKLNDARLDSIDFDSATLNKVCFIKAIINDGYFVYATLNDVTFLATLLINVNFLNAKFRKVEFAGTVLEKLEYKEITRPVDHSDPLFGQYLGHSLELTKPKEEENIEE